MQPRLKHFIRTGRSFPVGQVRSHFGRINATCAFRSKVVFSFPFGIHYYGTKESRATTGQPKRERSISHGGLTLSSSVCAARYHHDVRKSPQSRSTKPCDDWLSYQSSLGSWKLSVIADVRKLLIQRLNRRLNIYRVSMQLPEEDLWYLKAQDVRNFTRHGYWYRERRLGEQTDR
jgi:hypothetical protein